MEHEHNLKESYFENLPKYERACNNIKEALKIFLKENEISYLTIETRVKEYESFIEKLGRKNYSDGFKDNEDFCGARVVLFYLNDIEKVIEIISKEFIVQKRDDKSTKLDINEFGYRSYHFIVSFKKEWLDTPNYRGLNDLKIEIQVRTILMHAWAEIEHKLGYKNKEQVPSELMRKLFMISAKLEEADHQFQELKKSIEVYKTKLIAKSSKSGQFMAEELNLNSFQALLDFYFPELEKAPIDTARLFSSIQDIKITINQIIELAEKIKIYVPLINEYIFGKNSKKNTSQSNIMSYAIEALILDEDIVRSKSSKSRFRLVEDLKKLMK